MAHPILKAPHLLLILCAFGLGALLGAFMMARVSTPAPVEATPPRVELTRLEQPIVFRASPSPPTALPGGGLADAPPRGCVEGRVRGISTSDQCCWVGQRWDTHSARCIGEPFVCPAGRGVFEGECVTLESRLSRTQVVRTFRQHEARFEACRLTNGPSEPGRVAWFGMTLSPQGYVHGVQPLEVDGVVSHEQERALQECITRVLRGVRFPPAQERTRIARYPFRY